MELILYYIKESSVLLATFFTFFFTMGLICFCYMSKFKQNKKGKIIFYGIFLQMNNIDIIKMSTIIIKDFIVVYSSMITKQSQVFMCIVMMVALTLIYIILSPKRMIYEIASTFMQIAILYLINIMNNYQVEVEETILINFAKIVLISFELIFTAYVFFREIDIISRDRDKKITKEIKKEKQKTQEEIKTDIKNDAE